MNVALAAMLGLSLAQPPAPASDYHPFNSRSIKFPIQFAPEKVKTIRKVELHVSNDGGQVWQLAAVAPPTQDTFTYAAPSDGRYWFHIVTEDLKGLKDPANLTTEAPAMKVLFDSKAPAVAFSNAKRTGDEVTVEWKIDDQFPKDDATRVYFRPVTATEGWQEVSLPANSRTGVRFAPGVAGPIVVRVTVADLAGNTGEGTKEVAGASVVNAQASTSLSSTGTTIPTVPPASLATPAGGAIPPPDFGPPLGGPIAPTPPAAMSPAIVPPPVSIAPPAAAPPMVAVPPPASSVMIPSGPSLAPSSPTPVPTFDPRNSLTPASGSSHTPTGPVIEASRAQVINALRFDLNYQVEQRGPSGISRVDLWVTRDDGKTWVWWSQHEGREAALKVNLGTTSNSQPEGLYGFRLVPVSGAGLSDSTPIAGDAPDMRVIVDVAAPVVKIFPAIADPNDPQALMLQWEATDKNFGDEPITLEWCEGATGPWRPVATSLTTDAPNGVGVLTKRLPNTGRYSWHVPTGLPPRVYLKVTAKDAAGNITEQVTREPILIDLMKPRAKITSIGTGTSLLPTTGTGPSFGPLVRP